MNGFENKMHALAQIVLKRELTETERLEYLELAAAMGMNNVEDFLYMMLVFDRDRDRVGGVITSLIDRLEARFDELAALEQRILDTLEASVERVLGEGARAIGRQMGEEIGREARCTLTRHEKFHFLRGQTALAGVIAVVSAVAYFFGAVLRFGSGVEGGMGMLESIVRLPAGGVVLLCASFYVALWTYDFWKHIQAKTLFKISFVARTLILVVMLILIL